MKKKKFFLVCLFLFCWTQTAQGRSSARRIVRRKEKIALREDPPDAAEERGTEKKRADTGDFEEEDGWGKEVDEKTWNKTVRQSTNEKKTGRGQEISEISALYEWEPGIRELQEAAIRYALLNRSIVASWTRRVRSAAWLPDLRVKFDQNRGAEYRLKGIHGTSGEWAEKEGDGLSYGIQLTWTLGRLVFNADELKVHREAQRIAQMREDVVHGVTRVFFERRRLQINNYLNPPRTARTAVSRRLAIERLESLLDGITGGWYGKELKKRRPPLPGKSGRAF